MSDATNEGDDVLEEDWFEDDLLRQANVSPGTSKAGLGDDSPPAYRRDRTFYRIIAASLGLAVVLCVSGAIWVTLLGFEVPQVLTAIGSAAIGAFAGVLVAPRVVRD